MGADLLIDHTADVCEQLNQAGIQQVDMVLSTAGTAHNLPWIGALLRPFGHLSAIDLATPVDLAPLIRKSISLHTEMVFSRMGGAADPGSQGRILEAIGEYVLSGQVRPIVTTRLAGLTVDSMKTAHALLEGHRTIGKIVIES
jgi:NADPH:quinone reductase-like Zn-dependent oxidoreductase